MGLMSTAATRAIRIYQLFRSGKPSPCRFYPSCSEYAIEAYNKHGFLKGSVISMKRIARCNPFGSHGVDSVPEHFNLRKSK